MNPELTAAAEQAACDILADAAKVAERCRKYVPNTFDGVRFWPTLGDPCRDAANIIDALLEIIKENAE